MHLTRRDNKLEVLRFIRGWGHLANHHAARRYPTPPSWSLSLPIPVPDSRSTPIAYMYIRMYIHKFIIQSARRFRTPQLLKTQRAHHEHFRHRRGKKGEYLLRQVSRLTVFIRPQAWTLQCEQKNLTHASSFMSSKPFEFLVGPEKKVYTIHSGLVARLSPVLDRLVNGDMEEAKKGSVEWKHVDEQTFIRFSQYAYMKTYEYPSFRPEPPADSRSGALRVRRCLVEDCLGIC